MENNTDIEVKVSSKKSNARIENPNDIQISNRIKKQIAMKEYRARLKKGLVNGPVNHIGDVVIPVQTQIQKDIIEDLRDTLENLNKKFTKDFTSSQLITAVLNSVLPALTFKERFDENGNHTIDFFIDDHIIQYQNLKEFHPELSQPKTTKSKINKI